MKRTVITLAIVLTLVLTIAIVLAINLALALTAEEEAPAEEFLAIGTVIKTDGFMAIVDEDEFVLVTEHDDSWNFTLAVGDIVVVTTNGIKKVASSDSKAYDVCFKLHKHLTCLAADDDGIIDLSIVSQYNKCSLEEFAELLNQNKCNYSTIKYLCHDLQGYAFDCPLDACIVMAEEGLITVVDGQFYNPNNL